MSCIECKFKEPIIDTNPAVLYETLIEQSKQSIILYGYVQSGKTKCIINLINKWISVKKKPTFIIVFGGTNNLLTSQTEYRLANSLNEIILNKNSLKKIGINFFSYNQPTIVNVTKTMDSYNTLINNLKSYFSLNDDILIIDDESDYGTIGDGNSCFHNSLKEIWGMSRGNSKLFFVTATPFANVINNDFEIDKIININTNIVGYYGIDKFSDKYKIYDDDLDRVLQEWIDNSTKLKNNADSEMLVVENTRIESHEQLCTKLKENLIIKKNNVEVIQLDRDEKYLSEQTNKSRRIVIISGVKGSRGFTFKSLLTEIMTDCCPTTTIDNILQKCRWFGYRSESFDFMKIYINDDAKTILQKANEILIDFHERFDCNNSINKDKITLLKQYWTKINHDIHLTNHTGGENI